MLTCIVGAKSSDALMLPGHVVLSDQHAALCEQALLGARAPHRSWTAGMQVASDLVSLLVAALAAGAVASTGLIASGWAPLVSHDILIFLVPIAYAFAGLYPAVGMNPVDELKRLTVVTSAVFVASLASVAMVGGIMPSWVLFLAGIFALATVPIGRAATRELFARKAWWGVPVVVFGAGRTAALVVERLQARPGIGMKPIACLDDDPAKVGTSVRGVPVTGTLEDARLYQRRGVRHALVAMPGLEPHELVPLIRRHGHGFPALVVVPNLFGVATVGVSTRDLGGVLGLFVKHNLLSRSNRMAKRCLDCLILLPGLLIGLPVIGIAALAVMAVSRGNPFYAQEREGKDGRMFRLWKLRTMHHDADALLERHLDANPEARAEWERYYKLSHDPRILPVIGRLLRTTSLDELPQIINVVRGEMSFVGPRPFPRYHLDAFPLEFRELRRAVRPGITGLWQVSSRSNGDVRVQEETDTFYIRNWSVWVDLYVLARTPWAVLRGDGAR